MASYTPNLNLYKPDGTDDYDDFRTEFNSNMDKIDRNGGNQNIATDYDDTQTYAVGDYVIYDGLLYKCVTAVTTAETFDPTKWTHVVVTDEMGSGGGGSGDTVAWTQIQQTGTKIAEININGTSQDVYAPQGGGSGGHTIYDENGTALTQENGLQFTGAVSVSDDSVNGRTVVDVEGGGNYYLNTIYSTKEKRVGYWTDGKPLYQKTVVLSNISYDSNWHSYAHGISNIDEIADIKGVFANSTESFEINSFRPTTTQGLLVGADSTNIRYMNNWQNDATRNIVITLQYTKTTDAPEPNPQFGNVIYLPTIYSEEERQVGVWRDGKPLYQKTLVMNNLNLNTSGTAVDITSLGVDMCCPVYEGSYYIVSGVIRGFARLEYQQPNEVYLYPAVNRTGTTSFITLQYTKTIDVTGSGTWTPSGELAHHYSTNEQVIGTWVDGKPLYERSISIAGVSVSTNQTVTIYTQANIKMKYFSGYLTVNDITYVIPEIGVRIKQSGDNIQISSQSGASWTISEGYVTIRYTKTTDV